MKPFLTHPREFARRRLEEAKKKIAGNLCVLTGVGSGGGFAACGGSGGKANPAEKGVRWEMEKGGYAHRASVSIEAGTVRASISHSPGDAEPWHYNVTTTPTNTAAGGGDLSYSASGRAKTLDAARSQASNKLERGIREIGKNDPQTEAGAANLIAKAFPKTGEKFHGATVESGLRRDGGGDYEAVSLTASDDGLSISVMGGLHGLMREITVTHAPSGPDAEIEHFRTTDYRTAVRAATEWAKGKAERSGGKSGIERLRSVFEAVRPFRRFMLEAKKKLAGNLCVLTGVGSGGGFSACSSASVPIGNSASVRSGGAVDDPDKRSRLYKALQHLSSFAGGEHPAAKKAAERAKQVLGALNRGNPMNAVPKAPTADVIAKHLRAGGRVQITTYTKSTIYDKRHADWFSNGKTSGELYVRRGKHKDQLTTGGGRPWAGIRLLAEGLDESKKKLVGNLCVNTGSGSGGGFTNCGGQNAVAGLPPGHAFSADSEDGSTTVAPLPNGQWIQHSMGMDGDSEPSVVLTHAEAVETFRKTNGDKNTHVRSFPVTHEPLRLSELEHGTMVRGANGESIRQGSGYRTYLHTTPTGETRQVKGDEADVISQRLTTGSSGWRLQSARETRAAEAKASDARFDAAAKAGRQFTLKFPDGHRITARPLQSGKVETFFTTPDGTKKGLRQMSKQDARDWWTNLVSDSKLGARRVEAVSLLARLDVLERMLAQPRRFARGIMERVKERKVCCASCAAGGPCTGGKAMTKHP